MDILRISDLRVDCVVGVYPHERHTPQPLRVDVELGLDLERAGRKESMRSTLHYGATAAQLVFLLRNCEFRMLETAAHALARYLLLPPGPAERRAAVEHVRLRLTKPDALNGLATPSIEIERDREWCRFALEQKSFGTVDVVHETRDAGIYRLNVAPGREIPLHVHREMREAEMVLTDGLHCQNKPIAAGAVHRWPPDTPHCYRNPSKRVQSILCVDRPRFIERDEIRVEGAPAEVALEAPFMEFG